MTVKLLLEHAAVGVCRIGYLAYVVLWVEGAVYVRTIATEEDGPLYYDFGVTCLDTPGRIGVFGH